MELNKIHLIDAIEGLKKLPPNYADIIVADPPYNIGKDFGVFKENWSLEEYVNWSLRWIKEALRVLKPTGSMFIFGFSEILAHIFVNIQSNKRWLVWHYTNKNIPSLNFWQRSHESIILCWKENYIFNRDKVREPYTEQFLKSAAGKVRKSTPGRFSRGDKETIYRAHENGALPRDVIKVPALAGGAGRKERWFLCKDCNKVYPATAKKEHRNHKTVFHPTQKPEELIERLILSAKPENGGIVIVPFAGSGTECVVAKRLKMNFIGFEINEDYIKIASKRLESLDRMEDAYAGKLFEEV
jgi:site-specific DNA-methyltransferase (adenine-specific)